MNNLDKIYQEFGKDICLFPFMATFYGQQIPETAMPCSVIKIDSRWNYENSLIESINRTPWIDLRKNFINGSCHSTEVCKTCSVAEQSNNPSPRMLNNQYFSEHINSDIINHVQTCIDNEFRVTTILSLDYAPSNYCNFECVMCSGGVSSSRNTFEIKIYGKENRRSPTFSGSKDFYSILKDVEILNFCGGETLLQTSVHELIDYLIENNLSEKLTISLLTNASKYPDKLVEKFKRFKNVFYTISIDGIGDVIEYQRRGCKWRDTEQVALNLSRETGGVINYVVTANNVFSFVETVDWFAEHNLDRVILSLVFDSNKNISIKVIPNDIRASLINKLSLAVGKYQKKCFNELIIQMINLINTNKYEPDLLDQFKLAIAVENSVSKKKLVDVVPEWHPYFND